MTTKMLTRVWRRPERRAATVAVLSAVSLSAICWYFGADAWHSLLLGSAITAVAVAAWVVSGAEVDDTSWRDAGHGVPRGARHDVRYLSGSLREGWGRVGIAAESRLKQVARQRLVLRHLDLGSPADRPEIEQLIGRRAYRILGRSGRRNMRLRSLVHCLDALEGLDAAHSPAIRPRPARRPPGFAQSAPRRAGGQ